MTENDTDRDVDPGAGQATETTERVSKGCDKPDEKDERQRRIEDYLRTALAMEDPLAANVGAVNSDLMLFGYSLQQAITKALETAPTALDEFGKLMPAIDSYMRISRQVERFAKLNQQLAAAVKARRLAKQTCTRDQINSESEETTF
jgi:hypothetical protein